MDTAAIQAIDPSTGEKKWEYKMADVVDAGVLSTASDLLFSGSREGYAIALDARTGALLWKANVGGSVSNGPMTYSLARPSVHCVRGRQLACSCTRCDRTDCELSVAAMRHADDRRT